MRSQPPSRVRTRVSFDEGWRFQLGENRNDSALLTYAKLRPWLETVGNDLRDPVAPAVERPRSDPPGVAFVQTDFDDSPWRVLDLPHDWGAEGAFDQALPGRTGKLPWAGVGWYRKRFKLPTAWSVGDRVELEFDGAMSHATVWLNGRFVGGWVYGYTSFRVDLTMDLVPDGENVVAVRINNLPESSRWYPGGGIYRHVWLSVTPQLRFVPGGTFVSTPRVTAEEAWVQVMTIVERGGDTGAGPVTIETDLHELDAEGRGSDVVTAQAQVETVDWTDPGDREACRTQTIILPHPRRWDLAHPHRYVAVSRLMRAGTCLDKIETSFGVRSCRFDADDGFQLNDRRVPLQGVCLHHDLGALGAAVNTRAMERQLEILHRMGCNAIRTAHNPPAPELLDLCDRLGFVVMVEAFDCWQLGKTVNDYGQFFNDWHQRDLRAMVRRDRNHPSVVMWSTGNEVLEQHTGTGWRLGARLRAIVREEDDTRPVTIGCSFEKCIRTGFQNVVDVVGLNYKPWAYATLREVQPQVPVYGSETSSCVSSRGEYFFPVSDDKAAGAANFHVSSYDLSAPPWAWPPDREFAGLNDSPHAAGEFVWTGFDYLGEPTPYNEDVTNLLNFSDAAERERMEARLAELGRIVVPSRSSYFGIVDLAGFPKDRFYLYQARWRPDLPVAHLLPHWNWAERTGEVTPVHLYTNGDEAELFLNGRSLGKRTRDAGQYRLRWDDVVYEPGELRAVVNRNGKPWAKAERRTTGPALALALEPDRSGPLSGGGDLLFITIRVVDANKDTVPRSCPWLQLKITGPVELVATDNGDPTSHEPFRSSRVKAFNGYALAIVRAQHDGVGSATITAVGDALPAAHCSLEVVR